MEFIPDFKTEFQFHDPSEIKKTFIIYFFRFIWWIESSEEQYLY